MLDATLFARRRGCWPVQTAWRNDQLVGAAPMRIVRESKGIPLENYPQLLQSGITPRCNVIFHPHLDPVEFFDSLFDIPGWDIMELCAVEMEQPISKALIEYLRRKHSYVIEPGLQSPYEVLGGTWESFYNRLGSERRREPP